VISLKREITDVKLVLIIFVSHYISDSHMWFGYKRVSQLYSLRRKTLSTVTDGHESAAVFLTDGSIEQKRKLHFDA
jgi:hypothetical protein